jgi:membrane-bound serine protease (ClpP class)
LRRLFASLGLALLSLMILFPSSALAAPAKKVYVMEITGFQQIDPGVAQFIKRVFADAEQDPNAVGIAIVLDTPGGLLTSALDIKSTLLASKLKTVVFVKDNAISAGALIATAAEKLYMHQGAVVGAAEPRVAGSNAAADYKTLSVVVEAFRSAAEARGRDPNIAQAMVDKNHKIPGQNSELLTLGTQDAVAKKYADGQANDLKEALAQAGLADVEIVTVQPTFAEHVGRLLTTPWVATMLLVVGVIAIGLEFAKPGVTVPGLIGVTSLGLFFLGNMLVGTANWVELSLALIGVLLLVIEAFVPGFGLFGVGGVIAMGASIFLAVPDEQLAVRYLLWASVAFAVAMFWIIRAIGKRGLGKLLTLEGGAKGWVPSRADLTHLIDQEGTALTVLRPAGIAQFGQAKIDVVTEGEYIANGTPVKVMRVDGTHVVVRSLSTPHQG